MSTTEPQFTAEQIDHAAHWVADAVDNEYEADVAASEVLFAGLRALGWPGWE